MNAVFVKQQSGILSKIRPVHHGNPDFFAGPGVGPSLRHAVIERFGNGTEFRTAPLERPVLYKRGGPCKQL